MPTFGDITRRHLLLSGMAAGTGCLLPSMGVEPVRAKTHRVGTHSRELNAVDFGARGGDGSDTTPALRLILQKAAEGATTRISFPTAVYDFWPDRAIERVIYASNNDPGLKRIAFYLHGGKDLEIDGQGSTFIFHAAISPFVLEKCRRVSIRNLSIDWKRSFHNEGVVQAADETGIVLAIEDQFPYRVQNKTLYFLDEARQGCGIRGRDPCPLGSLLEFNSQRCETEYMARDYYRTPFAEAVEIKTGLVRIVEPGLNVTSGNTLVFGSTNRNHPAFTISDCEEVSLDSTTIHHCGGMGIIAQRSENISLARVQIRPSRGRMVSLPADATHFVNCRGQIEMTDCLFENQLDDATNIHGIYAQMSRIVSAREFECRLVHPAQRGFVVAFPGNKLEFVRGDSLDTYAEASVRWCESLNDEYTRIALDGPVPSGAQVGDAIAVAESYPDVMIRSCIIQKNRARGLLLGSRGKILIENNTFHTPGAAILLEGDARYWFEQAGVRDLTIRKNRFKNCNFGVWGKAAIDVGAGIDPLKRPTSRYNRNVRIEENQFEVFDHYPIVSMYSVDAVTIRQNSITRTTAYPARPEAKPLFDITDSSHVDVAGNHMAGLSEDVN
jgi:Right handed beta helix region